MANPTPKTHTTTLPRLTVDDIREYVAGLSGTTSAVLKADAVRNARFLQMLNLEQERWRGIVVGVRGFAEFLKSYTWAGGGGDDPASGDSQVLLPADYAELVSGEIEELDSDGNAHMGITVLQGRDLEEGTVYGATPYDNTVVPVARLWGTNTANRRILEIYPAPADDYKIRVPYYALAEKLVNDGDVLEAPIDAHDGIQEGVAGRYLLMYGDKEEALVHKALADGKIQEVLNPRRREVKKPGRARRFEGYRDFRPDIPRTIRGKSRRPFAEY